MAQADYYLKIDTIEGESKDSKHKDQIELESFSLGVTNSGSFGAGGGGGAGKASFQDIHFTANIDKSYPKLQLACASGQHIKTAELTCRKAGGEQEPFQVIKLSDVLVSSVQLGGSSAADVLPMMQVSLNFAKIEFEYKEQKADGTLGSPVKSGWNLKENKKV